MKNYPIRHISIRVPWHDNAWDGRVCKSPKLNGACLRLPRIAQNKEDISEEKIANQFIGDLEEDLWPPCVDERATFMDGGEITRTISHPYETTHPETHGHLTRTLLRHPPYSAPAVPYRWMFSSTMEEFRDEYELDLDPGREPKMSFDTNWVQEGENQKALLNCFFEHIKPDKSLCFFYAKEVPFTEDPRRVLIGVGWVKHISPVAEYSCKENKDFLPVLWERLVQHSIRPDFKDGFLLPYQMIVEHSEENPEFDPSEFVAFAPDDRRVEFSFASEHVTQDGAIASLLSISATLERIKSQFSGPWTQYQQWVHDRLGELWKMRGPCPGLGAALCAFGINYGTFVAREIEAKLSENEDPWPLVEKVFQNPKANLSQESANEIGKTLQKTWASLKPERKNLLKLVSRFEITPEQGKLIYVQEEREDLGIKYGDFEILENPYLVYEFTRMTEEPVSVWTIDRGTFPEKIVRDAHPLPEPSALDAGTDARRIRALTIQILESEAAKGNTLISQKNAILQIRNLEMEPSCEVTKDLMEVAELSFSGAINKVSFEDELPAYQLSRLSEMGEIIRRIVEKRIKGKRLVVNQNWKVLLDQFLGPINNKDQQEKRAREEKIAALKEIAESRISVLTGPAGTGKTTVLSIICGQKGIASGGILLLAPTGKARVRMEKEIEGNTSKLKGFTIAQFLNQCGRYISGNYVLSSKKSEEKADTVIIDEASMLTEEMLGSLLDSFVGVKRLILIGDHRQLPPIGSGRPFVDIVHELSSENIDSKFPKVSLGYAELTVLRRQAGNIREDLRLAEWFSGSPIEPGEDSIFDEIFKTGNCKHIGFVDWQSPEEFQKQLFKVIKKELNLKDENDSEGFGLSIGGKNIGGYIYFNSGASDAIENWQILSPTRRYFHGVMDINRSIHQRYKRQMVDFALQRKYRKISKPMGKDQIVYGDKVINIRNHPHYSVYPKDHPTKYIANGEIGLVVGPFKSKKMKFVPQCLNVEFSSQLGANYSFWPKYFGEESEPFLELAYALTVHKSQGSEFGLVILVLPNPCHILTRELLYTALTRQKERVVILHQGNREDFKKYASDQFSETVTRLTNLFKKPKPIEINNKIFESNLISCTKRGELVRSKSEVIVADRMADFGIDYVYEKPLKIGEDIKYPDFTIEDSDSGRVYYWEHCGMLHVPEYKSRWEKKLRWYKKNKIIPYEEGDGENGILIVTRDNESGGISSEEIEKNFKKSILT